MQVELNVLNLDVALGLISPQTGADVVVRVCRVSVLRAALMLASLEGNAEAI